MSQCGKYFDARRQINLFLTLKISGIFFLNIGLGVCRNAFGNKSKIQCVLYFDASEKTFNILLVCPWIIYNLLRLSLYFEPAEQQSVSAKCKMETNWAEMDDSSTTYKQRELRMPTGQLSLFPVIKKVAGLCRPTLIRCVHRENWQYPQTYIVSLPPLNSPSLHFLQLTRTIVTIVIFLPDPNGKNRIPLFYSTFLAHC